MDEELDSLTIDDLNEFLTANDKDKFKVLLDHAKKNQKIIIKRRNETLEHSQEYEEINKQFIEFCHTKGIKLKFKVAFENMAENTKKVKIQNKENFENVKQASKEANPEFYELLHTKGLKNKVKLIVENIKDGAKNSRIKTKEQIERVNMKISNNIKNSHININNYSKESLEEEFNTFLKSKGLDDKYIIEIIEENN